jgi:hypothetical protein
MPSKKMSPDEKIDVLSQHVRLLKKLLQAQRTESAKAAPAMPSASAAPAVSLVPPRPQVVAVVITTLRDAQIMNSAEEETPLTDRFNQVQAEDAHLGHPGFRVGSFLDLLHSRLPWNWGIAPSELLSGLLATAGEIADRTLASV